MHELIQYLPVALFVFGGVCGALRLIPLVFRLDINVAVFTQQIEKLIAADNVDRALKLCQAAPTTLAARGTRGIIKAHQAGVSDSVGLREAYEAELGGSLSRAVQRSAWLSMLGLVAIVSGAGLGFELGLFISTDQLGIAGGALLLIAMGSFKAAKAKSKALAGRESLIRFIQDRALSS